MKDIWIAYQTIVRKETIRIMRIWVQTLLPPVITQSLYFLIFGKFIGSQLNEINGVSYMAFIVPGLVMMSVINNSYGNVVSSFFGSKFQRNIEELIVAPVPNWVIIAGFVSGGMIRGLVVGVIVFIVSCLFTAPVIYNFGIILLFALLTSALFALAGLINAIFARNFDEITIVPNFVLIPLIYLGGVFYSVSKLPEMWQIVSKFNPILYMVNGFRYGFHGFSDVSVAFSAGILILFTFLFAVFALVLLRKGTGIKS